MKKELYIYDLETYPNFFLFSFLNYRTKQIYHFEISDRTNDFQQLKIFLLEDVSYLVGFNNLAFDYPILHKTIFSPSKVLPLKLMWNMVQGIFNGTGSFIYPSNVKIPQIDLYKLWHYDNKNKRTSLKWLEFAMRMNNIQNLPYPPGTKLNNLEKDATIRYCENDLYATEKFFQYSVKHLSLRKIYSKFQNQNLLNASEITIATKVFTKKLDEVGILDRNKKSKRSEVIIKDVIFDYIKFKDPENQEVLDTFNSKIWKYDINEDKALNSIKFKSSYKNVKRVYAEGGLHSCGNPGIYETDSDNILIDVDFKSYYPHLTFQNGLHPAHIDEKIFNKIYKGFYNDRLEYPKTDVRNHVLKIVLNGTYGLSKNKYSFLYDPKWQLAITVNGQLLLTMLTERICNAIPKAKIIFENTDGAMYLIPKKDLVKLHRACNEIEDISNIPLETQECKKIVIRDVNNYINIISDKNVKYKGCFEINRDFHKNHSKRIVPIALAEYFLNDKSVINTLLLSTYHAARRFTDLPIDSTAHNNLSKEELDLGYYQHHEWFDYMIGSNMKGKGSKLIMREINGANIYDEPLQKVNRYVVTKTGGKLIKILDPLPKNLITHTDKHKETIDANQMDFFDLVDDVKIPDDDPSLKRETELEVGYNCTIYNKYPKKNIKDLIDYNYYEEECNKIINKIERK